MNNIIFVGPSGLGKSLLSRLAVAVLKNAALVNHDGTDNVAGAKVWYNNSGGAFTLLEPSKAPAKTVEHLVHDTDGHGAIDSWEKLTIPEGQTLWCLLCAPQSLDRGLETLLELQDRGARARLIISQGGYDLGKYHALLRNTSAKNKAVFPVGLNTIFEDDVKEMFRRGESALPNIYPDVSANISLLVGCIEKGLDVKPAQKVNT